VSFKGVSSASSERLSKILSETALNPIEPQHFSAVFAAILYGWLWRVHSSKEATKRDKYSPSLSTEQTTTMAAVEAGWDHHFVHSSMQGMTINHVIFAKS